MKLILNILLGYLLGSINPAALIARIKQKTFVKAERETSAQPTCC